MIINLVPDFSEDDLKREFDAFIERVIQVTEAQLDQIGLEFVQESRTKVPFEDYHRDASDIVQATKLAGASIDFSSAGGFNDQTGNLRSSIGFIILYNGQIVKEDFQESPRGTDKATGLNVGKEEATKLANANLKGWAIITVAGMEYASWVEARGYDVITGSTLGAEAKLRRAMENVLLAFK